MKLFTRIPVAWKLFLILLPPLLGFIYFATIELQREWRSYQETTKLGELSELVTVSSTLLSQLQRETNLSTAYITTPNDSLKQQLHAQWNATDNKIKDFNSVLTGIEVTTYGESFEAATGWAQGRLSSLSPLRSIVAKNAQKGTGRIRDTVRKYNYINELLLDIIAATTRQSSHTTISKASSAYVNFLHSKEQFVLQQSIVANTIVNDQFEKTLYRRLLEVLNEKQTYHKVFFSFANEQQLESLQTAVFSSAGGKITSITDQVLAQQQDFRPALSQQDWAILTKIHQAELETVEYELKEELSQSVQVLKQQTIQTLKTLIGFIVAAFVISLSLSISMIRVIHGQLSNLHIAMDKIANDANLAIRADKICEDEMGQMADDLNIMLNKLAHMLNEMDEASLKLTTYENSMQHYTQKLTECHFQDLLDIELIQNIRSELLTLDADMSHSLSDKSAINNLHGHLESICNKLQGLSEIEMENQKNKDNLQNYGEKVHVMTQTIRHLMAHFHIS